jgi:hypothetical protein
MKKTAKQIAAEICKTPGEKIRSKGQGRGLARGRGRGPIGIPLDAKKIAEEVIAKIAAQGIVAGSAGVGSPGQTPMTAMSATTPPQAPMSAAGQAPQMTPSRGASMTRLPPTSVTGSVSKPPRVKMPKVEAPKIPKPPPMPKPGTSGIKGLK